MSRYQIRTAEGRELERQAAVLRRSGNQRDASIKMQHAVQADIDKDRAVAHADFKARNARR